MRGHIDYSKHHAVNDERRRAPGRWFPDISPDNARISRIPLQEGVNYHVNNRAAGAPRQV